jgi:hypothetical protein
MRSYHDFNILIEGHKEAQEALNGKLPEFAAEHLGDIGLANAEQIGRLDLFQPAFLHESVDFEDKPRFDHMVVRIRHA